MCYVFEDQQLEQISKWYIIWFLLMYILDILNLIFAVNCYQANEIGYPITYFIFFCIDKLIMISASICCGIHCLKIVFLLLDILNLGWIYPIFCNEMGSPQNCAILVRFVISRGVFQNIIQFIFLFGLGYIEYTSISISYRYLGYILFIIQISAFVGFISYSTYDGDFCKKYTTPTVKVITILTYHLTFASFFYLVYSYEYGYKLIYLNFIIGIIQNIYILRKLFQSENAGIKLKSLVANLFFNHPLFRNKSKYMPKQILIADLLSQISRFLLLMIFIWNVTTLEDILNNIFTFSSIFQLNNMIVFFLNLAYFGIYLIYQIQRVLTRRMILLNRNETFGGVNKNLLRLNFRFVKKIKIIVDEDCSFLHYSRPNQNGFCQYQDCQEYYEMYKTIQNIQLTKNIYTSFTKTYYFQCDYHFEKLLKSQENISYTLLQNYKSQRDKSINMSKLIIKRIFKGFLYNQTNNFLIYQILKQDEEKQLLKTLTSEILSQLAFSKYFEIYSYNYMPLIKYDLLAR
ncbi:transmembrane protein, putative (macronuclear) [Tetrahymena thermophila SB210]|uniref:Transmembrane protein, putative n=1 Tax=Tetrahymena thermophila (strain SB210) TaxID=312017 RepID=W7XJE2_TETTS|nr:transmembrane protein, putative [Tetrahymena thermophila SB210]EWS74079.1 transmembrane protein, putative [Tetrahymena thermophila SB210]|eukprot:XP_012653412.1 transmembrane protein, putative [Tetrahymena thermophila SB210]